MEGRERIIEKAEIIPEADLSKSLSLLDLDKYVQKYLEKTGLLGFLDLEAKKIELVDPITGDTRRPRSQEEQFTLPVVKQLNNRALLQPLQNQLSSIALLDCATIESADFVSG